MLAIAVFLAQVFAFLAFSTNSNSVVVVVFNHSKFFFADSPLKCDLRFMNLFADFSPIKNQKQAFILLKVQGGIIEGVKVERKIFGRIGLESGLA